MADEKKIPTSLSELIDEPPKPIPVTTVTKTPLGTVEEGDEKFETKAPLRHPDGRLAGMPTKIHTVKTPEQQLREAQCRQKPCASCGWAEFPGPNTPHRQQIEAMLRQYQAPRTQGGLGIWQGLTADHFIWCEECPYQEVLDEDGKKCRQGGPGGKWLGYNCPCWRRRQEDLLPDWVPSPIVGLVDTLSGIGDKLRRRGVRGFLAAMRADLLGRGRGLPH